MVTHLSLIFHIQSNCQEILSRIRVCRVTSLLHVIQVLYDLVSKFDSNGGQEINIVILDSVPTHFYSLLDSAHNCKFNVTSRNYCKSHSEKCI